MFHERAAIREFDGEMTRRLAEALALADVVDRFPAALARATVLWVELDGETHWYVTTDLDLAREQLAGTGGAERGRLDVAFVVDENFGGLAQITEAKWAACPWTQDPSTKGA
jgi:hypothetical protein